MAKNFKQITLALAGIFQAAALVKEYALYGRRDESGFETSLHSILQQSPGSFIDVYGSINGLKLGLTTLHSMYHSEFGFDEKEVSRYVVSIIHIQKLLYKNKEVLNNLARKLQHIIQKVGYFDPQDPLIITDLAKCYTDTISTLDYRINIQAEPSFLEVPEHLQLIRVMLLAGIRSAVLWQQVGGTRWQLFFSRKKIIQQANELIKQF